MSVVMLNGMRDMSRTCQGETSRSFARLAAGIFPRMSEGILARIEARLLQLGISARKASLDGGLGADGIRDMRRKPNNSITLETLEKLAVGLQTSPEWLAFDIDSRPAAAPATEGGLRVEGEVAAGSWIEVNSDIHGDGRNLELFPPVPVALDPRWPAESQFGLIVRGTCINRIATAGDILACVDCYAIKRALTEDDLVVVERHRDGGHLVERTAKFYLELDDRYELWPDSTDARWQSPIIVPKTLGFENENDDGISVNVRAVVMWVHRPAGVGWKRTRSEPV